MTNHEKRLRDLEVIWPKPASPEWDEAILKRCVAGIAAERGVTVEALLAEPEQTLAAPPGEAAGATTVREAVERIAAARNLALNDVFAEVELMIRKYGNT